MPRRDSDTAREAAAAGAARITPWTFETQLLPLLAVKPVNPFVVIAPALSSKHHVYAAVTVMHPGFGDLADAQAQRTVTGSNLTISKRIAAES